MCVISFFQKLVETHTHTTISGFYAKLLMFGQTNTRVNDCTVLCELLLEEARGCWLGSAQREKHERNVNDQG